MEKEPNGVWAVPDAVLRELEQGDPGRQMGQITPAHQIILAMYLPDICAELRMRRITSVEACDPVEDLRGLIEANADELIENAVRTTEQSDVLRQISARLAALSCRIEAMHAAMPPASRTT